MSKKENYLKTKGISINRATFSDNKIYINLHYVSKINYRHKHRKNFN